MHRVLNKQINTRAKLQLVADIVIFVVNIITFLIFHPKMKKYTHI